MQSLHLLYILTRLEAVYMNCVAHAYSYKEEKCKEMEMCHLKEVAPLAKCSQVGGACADGWVCFPLCTGRWEVMYVNTADMVLMKAIHLAALLCPAPSATWEQPHQNSHMSEIFFLSLSLLLLSPFRGVSSKLTKPWESPSDIPPLIHLILKGIVSSFKADIV